MMTFEKFGAEHYDDLFPWTWDAQFLIYQCDCVGIHHKWVISRLNENDLLEIYTEFINRAREELCLDYFSDEEKQLIQRWLVDIQRDLYKTCMAIIKDYCLPRKD